MIRGIGPVYAKKLLRAFADKVFEVIEAEPQRLREVDGIGPIRAGRITAAWALQKAVREIMVFLHSHGVGTARAVRIYKTYGGDAVQVMSENPYRLARVVGQKKAVAIAVRNVSGRRRWSKLREWLTDGVGKFAIDCKLPAPSTCPGRLGRRLVLSPAIIARGLSPRQL